MSIEVETTLEAALEMLTRKIEAGIIQGRATNVLLLANAMNESALEPVSRAKVLRHLESLESAVKGS